MHKDIRTILRDIDETMGRAAIDVARTGGSFTDFAGVLRGHTSHSDADLRAAFASALLDEITPSLTARQA